MLFALKMQTLFVLKPQYALKRHKLIFKGFKVLISFTIHTHVYNACQKYLMFYILDLSGNLNNFINLYLRVRKKVIFSWTCS